MNIDRRSFITRSLLAAPFFGAAIHAWLQCHRKPKAEGKWVIEHAYQTQLDNVRLLQWRVIDPQGVEGEWQGIEGHSRCMYVEESA